jgi:drug/metabolite transporter (DMT)-like permease
MIWPLLALLTAVSESLKDVFAKKVLRTTDEYLVTWGLGTLALPLLLPLLVIQGMPLLGPGFWPALAVGGTLNGAAILLYMKAIKGADLSITVPLVTFTPLFMLVTSPLILGEFPNIFGIVGILLIVLGSYLLNYRQRHAGLLAPFRALVEQKGARLMLGVAFIWSITANIDKIGVGNSSPLFWGASTSAVTSLAVLPAVVGRARNRRREGAPGSPWQIPRGLLLAGLFSGMTLIFQMSALQLTLVAYVISIKRTSVIMSVLFGHFLFKEKDVRERLAGAGVMLVGVIVITLLS